ncbi:MAG: pyridoxamine 5'-phosphate oxidase family protein [Pseudomonadota bacterium]
MRKLKGADDLPAFYDDLDLSLRAAWSLLAEGAIDRRSPVHVSVVGSIDAKGLPSQRVMVLREADSANHRLRFHTDARAAKVGEFGADGAPVSILAYHPEERIQLRLNGHGWIEKDGPAADAAWAASTNFAKRCYLADPAPGLTVDAPISGLSAAIEGHKPSDAQVAPARTNFAILLVEVERIEWLYLANAGHRRAVFEWDTACNRWQCSWLVP